ncbi:hypothetical protein GGR55DRAFT_637825 [Xylaria sp. FL0064]|nr:hypothetical protein GGR55DRAFT_637825 [Xylaria sp. FL0064]
MFIIGLLTVLSPVNTTSCPSLRIHLTDHIAKQVEGIVGWSHPISVVSRELRKPDQEPSGSDVLIAFLSDLYTSHGHARRGWLNAVLGRT